MTSRCHSRLLEASSGIQKINRAAKAIIHNSNNMVQSRQSWRMLVA